MSEQKQQHISSIEHRILEISEEDLEFVSGGRANRQADHGSQPRLKPGYTFVPSRNNPTAGSIVDKHGNYVAIVIGNCSAGPC